MDDRLVVSGRRSDRAESVFWGEVDMGDKSFRELERGTGERGRMRV